MGQTRRFHFHAGQPKVSIISKMIKIATVEKMVLFSGPQGIYTVDIKGLAPGSTAINGNLSDNTNATLKVTVKAVPENLALPMLATEAGMLARLLLAEAISPSYQAWSAVDVKIGMEWMRLVISNRLKWPTQFGAKKGSKKLEEIVRAQGQFKGFENYPPPSKEIEANIARIVATANDLSAPLKDNFYLHVKNAITVASADGSITDPTTNSLIGWRTAGSGSPGPNFELYMTKLGIDFYQWKKKP